MNSFPNITMIFNIFLVIIMATTLNYVENSAAEKQIYTLSEMIDETTLMTCSITCAKNQSCKSFNFDKSGEKISTCEISREMKSTSQVGNIAENENNDHLDKLGSCNPNPCLYGGICTMKSSDLYGEFSCDCPKPMSGKTCSEVECPGELCYRNDKLIIYIVRDGNTPYLEAKQNCEAKKRSLLMIKDEQTNTFVRDVLVELYRDYVDLKHCYFIGLTKVPSVEDFEWVDGTRLGDFIGWSENPGKGDCVCLPNGIDYGFFLWDRDDCDNLNQAWKYFYICEERVDF